MDNIGRAQVSAGVAVMIAVAVSVLFLFPDMYSAPYLPIGVSLLAVAGLLTCSTVGLRAGLRFWIFPTSLAVSVLLVLVLMWSIYDSQQVLVSTWTITIPIVTICLVTSVILALVTVLPAGRRRLGASLTTIASGAATVLCLSILPVSLVPVQPAFFLPALLAAVCLAITAAELVRSRRTVRR
jgi:hypothetical protein